VHEDERLGQIDAAIASMRGELSTTVLDDYADIISMRVARIVADWYMYDPEFIMTDAFRVAIVERLAQGYA